MTRTTLLLLATLLLLLTFGCTSGPQVITSSPSDSYRKMGKVEGNACGFLGLALPPHNFVPLLLNSRYERAYNEALAQAPGATGLVDVTLSENWYWAIIGSVRCVTIAGEAIK